MATDSLVIADLLETLGGGVASTLPALVNAAGVGAQFRLLGPSVAYGPGTGGSVSGYDLGAPQPTTDVVRSMLLDGERPAGYRSSNRTITLPLLIKAPDQATMNAAREVLMQTVDRQSWPLTWTPGATGLPMIFDCFRALPTVISYGLLSDRMAYSIVTLKFSALPYGRSDPNGLVQVPFTSPLLNGVAAPPAPVVLDNFASVAGTNWTRSTAKFVTGPGSAHYTPPAWPQPQAVYTKTGLSVDLTGRPVLSVWFGQSYDTDHFGPWSSMASNVTLCWTLTDNLARTLSFSKTYNQTPWSNSKANPAWTRISAPIPQGNAAFNYTNVTGYTVKIFNWVSQGTPMFCRLHAWLDNVTREPAVAGHPRLPARRHLHRHGHLRDREDPRELPVSAAASGDGHHRAARVRAVVATGRCHRRQSRMCRCRGGRGDPFHHRAWRRRRGRGVRGGGRADRGRGHPCAVLLRCGGAARRPHPDRHVQRAGERFLGVPGWGHRGEG